MNQNPYLEKILSEMEAVEKDWDEIKNGRFQLQEVFQLVGSLVRTAEAVITAPKSGAQKHQLVRDAFEFFNLKYRIINRIDDLITLPFFLEPFDGPFLRKVIDFLIGQAVTIFNATIWKNPATPIPATDDMVPP